MNKGDMSFEHSLHLEIPFESMKQADVARKVLLPDPIMKPEDFQVTYSTQDTKLICDFESVDERILRRQEIPKSVIATVYNKSSYLVSIHIHGLEPKKTIVMSFPYRIEEACRVHYQLSDKEKKDD